MLKKIKKLWQNKIFKNYFLFFICFCLLEILFRVIDGMPIFNVASLRILLGIHILSLFFGYLLSFLPKLGQKMLVSLLVFVATIYGIAGLGFHHFFRCLC